jgi:hypothetical protein
MCLKISLAVRSTKGLILDLYTRRRPINFCLPSSSTLTLVTLDLHMQNEHTNEISYLKPTRKAIHELAYFHFAGRNMNRNLALYKYRWMNPTAPTLFVCYLSWTAPFDLCFYCSYGITQLIPMPTYWMYAPGRD